MQFLLFIVFLVLYVACLMVALNFKSNTAVGAAVVALIVAMVCIYQSGV